MIFIWAKLLVMAVGYYQTGSLEHNLYKRQPASGFESSYEEKQSFYHMSEGSDIYPYDWLVHLKSAYEKEKTGNWDKGFFDGVEARVNVIKDTRDNKYLLDHIGLSTSWSGYGAKVSDAYKSEINGPLLKWVGSTPSVRMVGVNCAFCHTGKVNFNGQSKVVDGSQGEVNIQRLYADMIISTISLLFNSDDLLEKFLVHFDYSPEEAKVQAKTFAKQTLKETGFTTKMRLLAKQVGMMKTLNPRTFANEMENITRHFERLLRLTHHMKPDQDLGIELHNKLQFLANFAGGSPKFTTQGGTVRKGRFHKSNDGFGRLEAFISAGNRIFRDRKDWVSVDAPVGMPAIWDMGNRAIFHYTGNTNATFVRNIGQSVSLGAVKLEDENHGTSKVESIGWLEKYSYNFRSPVWNDYFTPDFVRGNEAKFKINLAMAEKGKKHFEQNCASCHTPTLVGPNKNLEYYPYTNLEKMGTDQNLARGVTKPVRNGDVYSTAFVKTMQGILETYQKEDPGTSSLVNEFRERDKRGTEWIREGYDPNNDQHQGAEDGFPVVPKGSGYVARNLRGIWATAPYLHNNSVPTLWDLLQPASKRPQVFERGINDFDPEKVGLKQRHSYNSDATGLVLTGKDGHTIEKKDCEAFSEQYNDVWEIDICLDTKLSGNSNQGHEKGVNLLDSEKLELIEYLKTLN